MKLGSLVRIKNYGRFHYGIVIHIGDSIVTVRRIITSYGSVTGLVHYDDVYWITDVDEI